MTSTTPQGGGADFRSPQQPPPVSDGSGWNRATEVADRAGAEAGAKLGAMRSTAAQKLETLSWGAEGAAERLRMTDLGMLSTYVDQLSESMKRLSGSLRDKSGDELVHEVGRLARENPGLFVSSGMALGFGLTRFAKAASPERRSQQPAKQSRGKRQPTDIVAMEMPGMRPVERREICP